MVKLIMFDLGNVLLKDTGYDGINNEIGKKLSTISYQAMFDANFTTELQEFCKEYHYDETYLRHELIKYFKNRYTLNMSKNEIQKLACTYKLGIASNWVSDIIHNLDSIEEFLSLIMISGKMEIEKPNKEFFNRMVNEANYMGIFAGEILFIDDKIENLQAAGKCGIRTLHYNNAEMEVPLYNLILNYINQMEEVKEEIIDNNAKIDSYLNHVKERPKNILAEKLRRQNNALYTFKEDPTVGSIPVLDTYGFKPTEPETPFDLSSRLKKLDIDSNKINEEELFFNEQLMVVLQNIEISYSKEDTYPVYILLSYTGTSMSKIVKAATKEPYSHSSIAFDSRLRYMYSFTKLGFTHENLLKGGYQNKGSKFSLYVLFVNEKQLKAMDTFLTNIKMRKDSLNYSLRGCLNNFFNKETHLKDEYFCSQFVAELIKQANESIVKKDPSLYTPYDIRKIKNLFFIQKGLLSNYDYRKTERRTNEIKEKVFSSIKNEGIISSFLRSTDNGSLILRYRALNFKEEYNKSHRYIELYKKTGDIESIKRELAKLWSYYLIIEEIYVQKGKNNPELTKTQKYKDAIIAKAFILGDIKTGLEYIKKKQPKFDFGEYYENSKYNKDAILITKKDIKMILSLIKTLI